MSDSTTRLINATDDLFMAQWLSEINSMTDLLEDLKDAGIAASRSRERLANTRRVYDEHLAKLLKRQEDNARKFEEELRKFESPITIYDHPPVLVPGHESEKRRWYFLWLK